MIWMALFDGGGSTVDNEGTYDFATVVDLGSKFTSRVTSKVEISRLDYVNTFDDAAGLFDAREGFFDGDTSSFGDTNATLQIATTDDDPSGRPRSQISEISWLANIQRVRSSLEPF